MSALHIDSEIFTSKQAVGVGYIVGRCQGGEVQTRRKGTNGPSARLEVQGLRERLQGVGCRELQTNRKTQC